MYRKTDLTPDPAVYVKVCPVFMEDPLRRHEFRCSDLRQGYCNQKHRNYAKRLRSIERGRLIRLEAGLVKGKTKKKMLARGIRNLGVFEALRSTAIEKDKSTKGARTLADISYSVPQMGIKGIKKSAPTFERAEKVRPEIMEGFVTPKSMLGDDPAAWMY